MTQWQKTKTLKAFFLMLGGALLIALVLLAITTKLALRDIPNSSQELLSIDRSLQIRARDGTVLSRSYQSRWNVHQIVKIHQVPDILIHSFLISEDQRFYQHSGVDWLARFAALWANVSNGRKVRGASTISEQVVRLIHPRKRTAWSRWLEGFEASILEQQWSKQSILEFYLNQVPYASNRRGVVQAAQYYFDRSLDTLNTKESLALVVLVRAPSRYDLWRDLSIIDGSIQRLSQRVLNEAEGEGGLQLREQLSPENLARSLTLRNNDLELFVPEFVGHVRDQISRAPNKPSASKLMTTIDPVIQRKAQSLLDHRLHELRKKNVNNAALLVLDRDSAQVLAWVNGANRSESNYSRAIDAVTAKRQVGSVLKPLVYALAIERNWTAGTLINDAPLAVKIGHGQHHFRNYSGVHYGLVSLRNALGNSLNIPAVRAVEYVGVETYLHFLESMGMSGVAQGADLYGSGIALGNIELSLFDVVAAYTTLARVGRHMSPSVFLTTQKQEQQRLTPSTALVISDILQDANARDLEFGSQSILNFPISTAVKTGTSSGYRDSWVVAYDHNYIIGAWMGNLNGEPSRGVTGSTGPAIVVRSLFDQLRQRHKSARPQTIAFESKHDALISLPICVSSGQIKEPTEKCETYSELVSLEKANRSDHISDNEVDEFSSGYATDLIAQARTISFEQPSNGLHMALDPRVPISAQAYEFILSGVESHEEVHWQVNDQEFKGFGKSFLWPLKKGKWNVAAKVHREHGHWANSDMVSFLVK